MALPATPSLQSSLARAWASGRQFPPIKRSERHLSVQWLFDQVSKAEAQIHPAKLETDRPRDRLGERENGRERAECSSLLPIGTALPSAVAWADDVHLHTPWLLVTAAASAQTWGHTDARTLPSSATQHTLSLPNECKTHM